MLTSVMFHVTQKHIHQSEAFSAPQNNGDGNKIPPPPKRLQPNDQQAIMLQKMGFTWNGQKWIRGDSAGYAQRRAVARSGNRFSRFVEPTDDGGLTPASTDAAVAAAGRMEEVLLEARAEVVADDRNGPRDRDFKNFCQKKEAPLLYLAVEILVFAGLSQVSVGLFQGGVVQIDWRYELQHFLEDPFLIIGLGLLAGSVLSLCRATSRQLLPGVEEPDGKLVRVLADAMDGNFALPAPNHIRYDSRNWKLFATIGEIVAAVNISTLMNGLLQPVLGQIFTNGISWASSTETSLANTLQTDQVSLVSFIGAYLAVLLVALPACVRVIAETPWDSVPGKDDGIQNECEGLIQSKQKARSYFTLTKRPTDKADPTETAVAFEALVDGWIEQFDTNDGKGEQRRSGQPTLAFAGSFMCALAWQLSGQSLVTPFLARTFAAIDTYLLRDEKESCRVNVLLPQTIEQVALNKAETAG